MKSDIKIVYHYCSADVFTKIISDKAIRLSDITKSNDSMEILWITRFIKDIFDEEFYKEASISNRYPQKTFAELIEHYTDDFFKEDARLYSYMVCCFSEIGDLLSQWRGYADDASGFSIGFDADALSTFGKHSSDDQISSDVFDFDKIIYSEFQQKNQIRKCAKQLISDLKTVFSESKDDIKQHSMVAFNRCFLRLFSHSIFMKNPFFKEEKEWRICYCANLDSNFRSSTVRINDCLSLSNVHHYSKENDIVPYVDLSFKEFKNNIIKKVFIGPKCRASKKEILTYLQNNNIVCEVEKSSGTYR